MRQHHDASCLFLVLTLLVTQGLVPETGLAQTTSPRTFLVDFGQVDFKIEVNGQAYVTDHQGLLRLTLEAANGEALRFRSLDPRWVLNLSRQVPVEDPSIPVLWDLRSKLRPTQPSSPEPSPEPSSPESSPGSLSSARTDPCSSHKSLRCRQARWMEFERAKGRGDCEAAVNVLARLEADFPDLLTAEAGVLAFANTFLDCGQRHQDTQLIRRSLDLALAFDDGGLWCRENESRLLARGFEALGDLRAAAESAGSIRPRCAPENTAALEWEVYFRVRLGETESLEILAQEAPRKLLLFFQAWLESSRGECTTEVEVDAGGDLPCRGLPQDFCARQYGRILLRCGDAVDDFTSAARYLRAALPADPDSWSTLAGGPRLILELAEAEVLSGDAASAISLYERLLQFSQPEGGGSAMLWRLYGDALLLAAADARDQQPALAAYTRARDNLEVGSVDFAVVTNNLCVLRGRLDEAMMNGEIVRDLEALEAAIDQMPSEESRLRLRLQHNALSLRIRWLEKATDLDAQQQLARLQELRGPFADYHRELASSAATAPLRSLGGSESLLEMFDRQGRRFAVAVP